MNVSFTRILARKILIAFSFLIIILCIAAFFVRSSITGKLERIAELANNIEHTEVKPQESLLLLQQAEDDFQQSLLDPDSAKSNNYKRRIATAFNKIDTLLKSTADTASLSDEQTLLIRKLYQKKIQLSGRLMVLRHNFDSLLTIYARFDDERQKELPPVKSLARVAPKSKTVKADTIQRSEPVVKKKLLGRIKDAISNKAGIEKNVLIIKQNEGLPENELLPQKAILYDQNRYSKQLQQLQQQNVRLQHIQQQLINLNLNINNELSMIISDFKDINYKMSDELKKMSFQNYQDTTAILNKFHLVALILVGFFAALLILSITQLNKAERFLRNENNRSVIMAQQKMDLLLHMSHEIRNPLTSIKGFLHIFSKTTLTERQLGMLNSIRFSSDMLLITLNDTLDAAKMENSEFRINVEPFNPNIALTEVIDSMKYSALKKGLEVFYNFKGEKKEMVLGDSFRLRQILVNLYSNAIKYTAHGTITVNAELLEGNKGLQLQVIDTGAGISSDQQANLFSKYYQTASSKGQVGTGLGLYICKQLVERQGGTITVESKIGTGTTFSVTIPYKRTDLLITEDSKVEDMVSSVSGISILAVDDHELNLMLLKMITSKWNISFHQAENAEDALEMIKVDKFDLVLTDIQLPKMNGNEFLAVIRVMEAPICKIPVIAFSGLSDDVKGATFLEQGFSGFISKPFIESELLKQIVKVLRNKQ